MHYEDTIEIRGVTMMRRSAALPDGESHRWIAPTQLQPDSTVACEGDVGTTFSDVPMAGDTGLKYLVNEHAMPSLLAPEGKHRLVIPSAPRQGRHPHAARHQPGAGVTSTDRYSLLRERMIGLLRSRLLLLGILVAPLVIAGYVGLTVLLFLPLLGLRRMFPRRSVSSLIRWDTYTPLDSGLGNLWAKTRSA